MLATAKLDAASHHWVTSFANYNFRLHYRAGKANIDANALSRLSWPGCMPDNTNTHIKVTAAAMQAVQDAALQGPASPIEAYSSDLHVLDVIQDSNQVASMTLEDWHQAQEADPILSPFIARQGDGMLGKSQFQSNQPPKVSQCGREWNHLVLKRGILYRQARPRELEETLLQLDLQLHIGRLLSEDAMMRLATWAWSTCWISCMTGSSGLTWLHSWRSMSGNVAHVLPSKPGSKKPPSKTLWPHTSRAGPPWLLVTGTWEGPGRECSGSHRSFTRYAQAYVTKPKLPKWMPKPYGTSSLSTMGYLKRSLQIKVENLKVSWWPTSVSWCRHRKCRLAIPSANQWPVWRFNSTLINMLGTLPNWKEVRVKKSHWNIGSCI